jgi:hypothetical protein
MNVAVDLLDELVTATRHNAPWRSHYLPTLVRILIAAGEVVEAQSMIEDIDVTATRPQLHLERPGHRGGGNGR